MCPRRSSGTGKTTLGYILKGLIPHAIKGTLKGNVIVAGLDLQKASLVTTAKSIGMVFQDLNAQLFNLTVQEEIEFGLRNLRLPLEWAKEAMNLLSLEELAQRNPLNLSAGQKQRVILASIIAIHPRVLILDEPSAHLDHQSRVQLKNWLLQLQTDQQMTIILIEQDPWLVGKLCQRYFFLKDAMLQEVMKEDLSKTVRK